MISLGRVGQGGINTRSNPARLILRTTEPGQSPKIMPVSRPRSKYRAVSDTTGPAIQARTFVSSLARGACECCDNDYTPSPAEAEFDGLTSGLGTIQLCL
jgi:hypothetical protein